MRLNKDMMGLKNLNFILQKLNEQKRMIMMNLIKLRYQNNKKKMTLYNLLKSQHQFSTDMKK